MDLHFPVPAFSEKWVPKGTFGTCTEGRGLLVVDLGRDGDRRPGLMIGAHSLDKYAYIYPGGAILEEINNKLQS